MSEDTIILYCHLESSHEHMLYPKEIASMYNICSSAEKPHKTFLTAYLRTYVKEKFPNYNPYFYPSSYKGRISFVEVFPRFIFEPAMIQLCEKMPIFNKIYNFSYGNTTFRVMRKEANENG